MKQFLQTLREQRWDDHRYYHQSRINQSLHFVSAITFLVAYVLLFIDPAWAAIVGWCVAMTTRQAGHFFFEPRGYDLVNNVSDAYKEEVKVGYNIRRKIVLLAVWAGVPALLWLAQPAQGLAVLVHDTGIAWLALGAAGLLFRVAQLWHRDGAVPALAWMTKILTDPVHDIVLYHKAPLALLRGELIDPMTHARQR